jgi:hypothetical protein
MTIVHCAKFQVNSECPPDDQFKFWQTRAGDGPGAEKLQSESLEEQSLTVVSLGCLFVF